MKGNAEFRAIAQSLYRILTALGPTDKLKIVKLLFLADKHHLLKYGRTITGDEYYAMKHGPAGSLAMDILNCNEFILDSKEREYVREFFSHDGNTFKANEHDRIKYNYLSETDIESLDYIITNFGNKGTFQLRDYTHKYPEWKQHEETLESGRTKRIYLHGDELFSILPDEDDPLKFSHSHIKHSKKIAHGAI